MSRPFLSRPRPASPGGRERLTPGGSVLSTCRAAAALARNWNHTGRVISSRSRRLTVRAGGWDPLAWAPRASGVSYSGSGDGLGADTRT